MWSITAVTGRKLTEEGRGRDSSITTRDHDADARLHKGHGEVHHLRPLLVDGEGADCHVRPLVHNLVNRTKWRYLFFHLISLKFYTGETGTGWENQVIAHRRTKVTLKEISLSVVPLNTINTMYCIRVIRLRTSDHSQRSHQLRWVHSMESAFRLNAGTICGM